MIRRHLEITVYLI